MAAPQPIRINLPAPHPAQAQIIREAQRFNVVCCGRRWGKSTLGIDRLVKPVLEGLACGWFSPSYKLLMDLRFTLTIQRIEHMKSAAEKAREILPKVMREENTTVGKQFLKTLVEQFAVSEFAKPFVVSVDESKSENDPSGGLRKGRRTK